MDSPDILELLRQLQTTHEEDRHLYRGQIRRYEPHRWSVQREVREVEALYPAHYRFHYQNKDFSNENLERTVQRASAARAFGRTVRDQFSLFLCLTLIAEGQQGAWGRARELFPELVDAAKAKRPPLDGHLFRVAWSLAQHYAIATALTDLTFSPCIAAWFATEPWDPGGKRPAPGTHGVIYRVHRAKLEAILARASELSRAMSEAGGAAQAPEFFLVDIRDVPTSFARRPAAQHGASLYGFDQAHIIAAAFKGGAIEAFEFEHRPGADIGVVRGDVVPADDPFLPRLARFAAFRDAL
ncbi:MAG TPA: FRG domain-containing protein, partial [Gemmatimonadaceae bacterium]|nr:FRG domain-containing protein [Gemmatimonadaceae bacterium]